MSVSAARLGPMRILNVIHSLNPVYGGPAEGLRHMCVATHRLGHLQEALTLDAPYSPWLSDFPAPVHAVGPALSGYAYTRQLVPWLHASVSNYDAVVVHGLWQHQGLAVRRATLGTPVPYYVYPHGMLDPWFRRTYPLKHVKKQLYWSLVERQVLRDACAVLFTTEEESRLAAQTFSPYAVNASTVGYGLDLDEAALQATAEDFLSTVPSLRGQRILLFLARIHPKKGLDLLIEAFAQVAAAHPGLQLVVAGPDEAGLRPALEQQAAQQGVADRITWVGMLRGAQKWGALRAAEVFALPSHQENFGIAVAEALAVGLPVLISDQVNIWREVVADGAGFAAPDTVEGTGDTLGRWLALDEDGRARMRQQAVHCYRAHFHIDASAERFLGMVSRHRTGHSRL
jgi:glycosyltransferase involved in cell wall biosynthesis